MPPPVQNRYVPPPEPQPQPQPQPQQPAQPSPIPPAGPGSPDYNFIMQPSKPSRHGLLLPNLSGSSSPIVRIGIILGGLLVVLILFVIIKGLLSGPGNTPALTSVGQDQQAMIHILTNGAGSDSQQQATLSANSQNFAATAQLSLTSAQNQLVTYMKNNGKKVKTKTLALKISPATDQELTTAASNSTYETTFQKIMQTSLVNYQKDLQAAYKQTKGPKGRQLLSNEFNGAQLLLAQLKTPAS